MNFDFQKFKAGLAEGLSRKNSNRNPAEQLLLSYKYRLESWQEKITTLKSGTPEYEEVEKKIKKYKGLLHIK
jgi:hypothetical protein